MTGRHRDAHSVMVESWLDQVLADPATTRMDFSVAWAVSLHFNRATRIAWAGVDAYAKRCHTDRRTVQRSLRRLENAGHLAADKGGGRRITNRYQPVLKNSGAGAALSDPENSGAGAAQPLNKRPLRTTDSRAGARESENAPDFAALDSKKQTQKKAASDTSAAFEAFWQAYPKRKAIAKARRAFAAAIKRDGVDPEILVAGAKRYALERAGKPSRFTKHPATWLTDGCWQDEPGGAVIVDEHGNVVAIEPERDATADDSKKAWKEIGEEFLAEVGDGKAD